MFQWDYFQRMGLIAHKAMDVPKKYRPEDIKEALDKIRHPKVGKRSTQLTKEQLKIKLPQGFRKLRHTETWKPWEDEFLQLLSTVDLGQIFWGDAKEIVLGEEAADHLRELFFTKFQRRGVETSILEELGSLLLQKAGRATPQKLLSMDQRTVEDKWQKAQGSETTCPSTL
jgi:hypothetical protein